MMTKFQENSKRNERNIMFLLFILFFLFLICIFSCKQEDPCARGLRELIQLEIELENEANFYLEGGVVSPSQNIEYYIRVISILDKIGESQIKMNKICPDTILNDRDFKNQFIVFDSLRSLWLIEKEKLEFREEWKKNYRLMGETIRILMNGGEEVLE